MATATAAAAAADPVRRLSFVGRVVCFLLESPVSVWRERAIGFGFGVVAESSAVLLMRIVLMIILMMMMMRSVVSLRSVVVMTQLRSVPVPGLMLSSILLLMLLLMPILLDTSVVMMSLLLLLLSSCGTSTAAIVHLLSRLDCGCCRSHLTANTTLLICWCWCCCCCCWDRWGDSNHWRRHRRRLRKSRIILIVIVLNVLEKGFYCSRSHLQFKQFHQRLFTLLLLISFFFFFFFSPVDVANLFFNWRLRLLARPILAAAPFLWDLLQLFCRCWLFFSFLWLDVQLDCS